MAFYQDKHVITGNARVLWDGITRPKALDSGGFQHSLKVAMLASLPEAGELESIAQRELQDGEFRGVMPPGGHPAVSPIRAGEYGDMLPGTVVFNSATYNGAPDVYDINGQKLDPAHYGSMLYPGATVQLIVSARTYNNVSKGIGFWLNGIKIIDSTTPKLPVGGGSIDAAAAFAGTPAAGADTPAPPPGQQTPSAPPPAPADDFLDVNGKQYTAGQLRAGGWTEAQIAAAR